MEVPGSFQALGFLGLWTFCLKGKFGIPG